MSQFDSMGKEALRAACKAAEVKGWGKMNNTQMRDALKAKQADFGIPANIKQTEAPASEAEALEQHEQEIDAAQNPDAAEHQADAPAEQLPQDSRVAPTAEFLETLGTDGVKGHCPHCNVHLDNGWQTVDGIREVSPADANKMEREYICLGCGGEYGPKIVRTPAKPVVNPTGIKIQKDREERNGVKRPSVGTICHAIWEQLDNLRISGQGGNYMPTFKDLKKLQDQYGWQRNTAVTQYQRWKEFNDLMVR